MSPHMTAVEVRAQNIDAMGAPLGVLYTALRNEVLWLHVVWHQYRVLFGTSAATVEFENKAAGSFFVMLNDTLGRACCFTFVDSPIQRWLDDAVISKP